jgi:hypothetical protein
MKTLMLYEGSEGAGFYEFEGDMSRFHDVYINAELPEETPHTAEAYGALQEELTDILYTEDGEIKPEELEAPTKDWDFFVRCGILE